MNTKEKQLGIIENNVSISYSLWKKYENRLKKVKKECPNVDINIGDKDSPRAEEHKERDDWGCLWHYPGDYLDGQVIEHPLVDWDNFEDWQAPDPKLRIENLKKQADKNELDRVGLEHGFLFLRLTYLRGFENFMLDVAEDNPKIYELRDIVTDYWCQVIEYALNEGATYIGGGDDLGLQDRLAISPDSWRKLIKPAYKRIFGLGQEYGASTYLHTDGYIIDIIPDLIEIGIDTLNPQDLVNGLKNLKEVAKGKVKIDLDIDRQKITVFSGPREIENHIHNCVKILGSPEGGLSLTYGVYPGTPGENIGAVIRAMEKYHDYWI